MEKKLWKHILSVRQQSPLVHNITNYVVMNTTANALLAVGASPIMAHSQLEVEEMVNISNALVINIGTLDEYWSEAMLMAAKTANHTHKPWILDPVGAGATSLRDNLLPLLLSHGPTVIRGNASEIIALNKANKTTTKGVDSTASSNEAIDAARNLASKYHNTVCISGETDIIISEQQTVYIHNGHSLMTKVTGLGCSATAIIGAFLGSIDNVSEAVIAGMGLLGVAGEIAAKESSGPGSLQVNLIDKLYTITEEEFMDHIKISSL
ncbi:hydroxyethylthiazole kinase [Chryseobacterium sp.]|uniref:hydroxyethylthiazole kinase n=1 Tax=Chryseobacterium sp. TaxID=1871047 RepID=UPI0025C339CA|nr:hydroxyethylthiazole kinase [Chryseobacterium sp.]